MRSDSSIENEKNARNVGEESTSDTPPNSNQQTETNRNPHFWNIFHWRKYYDLEIFMILYGMTFSLGSSFQDAVVFSRLCWIKGPDDIEECSLVKNYTNDSVKIDQVRLIADEAMSHAIFTKLMESIIQLMAALVLCPWSDLCGRKAVMIAAIVLKNVDLFLYFINYKQNFVFTVYADSLIKSIFGGDICVFAMSYSYASDHTLMNSRLFRYTKMDIGFSIGIILGAHIFQVLNNRLLHSAIIIAVLRCVIILWIIFVFVDEEFPEANVSCGEKISLLLRVTANAKISFNTLFKPRSNCGRHHLLLIIISIAPVYAAHRSLESIFSFKAQHAVFFPSFEEYKTTISFFVLYSILAEATGITFVQYFTTMKVDTVGILGFFSIYGYAFALSFANSYFSFLIAVGLTPFIGYASAAFRAIFSNIIQKHERGSGFLFLAASEKFAQVIAIFLHGILNKMLKNDFPNDEYLIVSGTLLLPFCTFVWGAISIDTEHLFETCYRTIQIPIRNLIKDDEISTERDDSEQQRTAESNYNLEENHEND